MKKSLALLVCFAVMLHPLAAPARSQSPTEAALAFYRALKERRYVEGFRHSIYRGAVIGLTPDEISELESEFEATSAQIPGQVEARGEQVSGDTATVFLKFEGIEEVQKIELIRVGGEWLVGDAESLELVEAQGNAFFFNMRIRNNEAEAYEIMTRLIGAQIVYGQKFQGAYASLEELLRLGALPDELKNTVESGYHFTISLSVDRKLFVVNATPLIYGKTGRLSFHGDLTAIRAEDAGGIPASIRSPVFQPPDH